MGNSVQLRWEEKELELDKLLIKASQELTGVYFRETLDSAMKELKAPTC